MVSHEQIVLDEALKEALQQDDVDTARRALEKGADANGWVPVHECMLLGAAANGSAEMIELLLEFGANPLATDRDNKNAYHKLAQAAMPLSDARCAKAIRALKDVGPYVEDAPNERNETPLHYAAVLDLPDCSRALVVDCGAELDSTDMNGNTPAHRAVEKNNTAVLYELLLLGTDIGAQNRDGLDVTAFAQEGKHTEALGVLEHFAALPEVDVTQSDLLAALDAGNGLLNPKFWQQAEQAIATLEEQDTPLSLEALNARDAMGQTPLQFAYRCGKLDVVLEHIGKQGHVRPQDLRSAEGKPTAFCELLVENGKVGGLFREEQWKSADVASLRDAYAALPPEGRKQVRNYYQLQSRVEMAQNSGIGR